MKEFYCPAYKMLRGFTGVYKRFYYIRNGKYIERVQYLKTKNNRKLLLGRYGIMEIIYEA